MFLTRLSLQNFRSYKKITFDFNRYLTLVVGPNTSGKSNLIEAIYLLATGKSFRADKDIELIRFGEEIARIKGSVELEEKIKTDLEIVIAIKESENKHSLFKKFLVNDVSKRKADFISNFAVVLFSPLDLDMITGSPLLRRRFFDESLEQVDREYSRALDSYSKAVRQRNALLEKARETGVRNKKLFEYWDELLISYGKVITQKREQLIAFFNGQDKDVFSCALIYDKSVISKERLTQYEEAELATGVTLVGPHRDDLLIHMYDDVLQTTHDLRFFGSRGQQRLTVLQLKLLQLDYIREKLGSSPVLLLDDIFSELDDKHIKLVLEIIGKQQTIITTTHEEFIKERFKKADMIKLKLK